MQLPVLDAQDQSKWYADGLKFTCEQCGNCCTGGPGYVWISRREIRRLAKHLEITPDQVIERYCREVNGKITLKETRNAAGLYDCIFLTERPAPAGSTVDSTETVAHSRRICSIYPVRPLQCRTWPFWPEIVKDPAGWELAARKCPGIDRGRTFSLAEIEKLRTARDWPKTKNAPGSAKS